MQFQNRVDFVKLKGLLSEVSDFIEGAANQVGQRDGTRRRRDYPPTDEDGNPLTYDEIVVNCCTEIEPMLVECVRIARVLSVGVDAIPEFE